MKRLIVCGGRRFADWRMMCVMMDHIHRHLRVSVVVQGGAPGADRLAMLWSNSRNVIHETHSAEWHVYGPGAGPVRNAHMLSLGCDGVVAFPGGSGTADMCMKARAADVPVLDVASWLQQQS